MKPATDAHKLDPEYVDEILPEHLPDNHLSIVVFGPGVGEAILVRLPDGTIGVVDGCREPKARKGQGDPIRELLAKFERTAKSPLRLEFVCLTHPHTDHFRGLGKLIQAYQGRIDHLWTVSKMIRRYEESLVEWLEIIRAGSAPDDADLGGLTLLIEQMHHQKKHLAASNPNGYAQLSTNKPLLRRAYGGYDIVIEACGPSDNDIDEAHEQLFSILDAARKGEKVSRTHDPNMTSGALLLRWNEAAVLLAGDLLNGKEISSGWHRAAEQINCKVQVVNVAHHASEEAHHEALWSKMTPALAIVTPFMHGKGSYPPRPHRIAELAKSSTVAITSPPDWDGESNPPKSLRPGKTIPRLPVASPHLSAPVAKDSFAARKNAVAVSLDSAGIIQKFVLAGQADVYVP